MTIVATSTGIKIPSTRYTSGKNSSNMGDEYAPTAASVVVAAGSVKSIPKNGIKLFYLKRSIIRFPRLKMSLMSASMPRASFTKPKTLNAVTIQVAIATIIIAAMMRPTPIMTYGKNSSKVGAEYSAMAWKVVVAAGKATRESILFIEGAIEAVCVSEEMSGGM